jgi:hypothetical protein
MPAYNGGPTACQNLLQSRATTAVLNIFSYLSTTVKSLTWAVSSRLSELQKPNVPKL